MQNLPPVLVSCNGLSDITVCGKFGDESIFMMLGTALLERIRRDPDTLLYKMAIGRMANFGCSVRALERAFKHDHRTIALWAEGLTTTDPRRIVQVYAGQGAPSKLPDAAIPVMRALYHALRHTVRDYAKRIGVELQRSFGVSVCSELLRQWFRRFDAEANPADAQVATGSVPSDAGDEHPIVTVEPGALASASPPKITVAELPPLLLPPVPERLLLPEFSQSLLASPESGRPVPAAAILPGFPPEPEPLLPPPPPPEEVVPVIATQPPSGVSSCVTPPVLSLPAAAKRNYSPAPLGLPFSGVRPGPGTTLCHHAGALLFAVGMDLVSEGRPPEWAIHQQWLGQILQGAPNIEQSKCINGLDLALFTGTRAYSDQTQRTQLTAQSMDADIFMWLMGRNARLVPDGPNRGDVFYLDPHTKEYTGTLKLLLGWCGRIHDTARVLHMDFIHSQSGLPVWLEHCDNYFDLRVRIFPMLDRFDQLFSADKRKGRIYVVDRGIYGIDTFQAFYDRPDDLLSWEKGYSSETSAWQVDAPHEAFELKRLRNHSKDVRTVRFEAQEMPWPRDPRIRRMIVRATSPEGRKIEVSILCTNPTITLQKAVRLMFCRWVQENDFKMLDRYFGIMELTSRRSESYATLAPTLQDQTVDSLEYRELKKKSHILESLLKKNLYDREHVQDTLDAIVRQNAREHEELQRIAAQYEAAVNQIKDTPASSPQLRKLLIRTGELAKRADEIDKSKKKAARRMPKLEEALRSLKEIVESRKAEQAGVGGQLETVEREDSRLRLLVEGGYRRLDTSPKAILDALRVTAHNQFAHLLQIFKPHYDNLRDDAMILRLLTRATGILRWNGDTVEVALWLRSNPEPALEGVIDRFFAEISELINTHFAGRAVPVKICRQVGTPKL